MLLLCLSRNLALIPIVVMLFLLRIFCFRDFFSFWHIFTVQHKDSWIYLYLTSLPLHVSGLFSGIFFWISCRNSAWGTLVWPMPWFLISSGFMVTGGSYCRLFIVGEYKLVHKPLFRWRHWKIFAGSDVGFLVASFLLIPIGKHIVCLSSLS